MVLAIVLASGCHHIGSLFEDAGPDVDSDTDTDTGPDCPLGEYSGDLEIGEQSDVSVLAGHTSISGNLKINCSSCTDLSELSCLTSVGGYLWIEFNASLTNLDGMSALTSVGGYLEISVNDILPDCEVCDLLDQLTDEPFYVTVNDNLDDSCTPVPANCPDK